MANKPLINNRLRTIGHRRRAFTLTELVVAVGLLLIMLGLAGQVLSLTVRSTGQANSLSQVQQLLRTFESQLREDLRHIRRGESVMVIQGNPINAYWTEQNRDADNDRRPDNGYPHAQDADIESEFVAGQPAKPRADMLMFFTARKAISSMNPARPGGALMTPVVGQVQQVVYGHADLGRFREDPNTGELVFTPDLDAFPEDPDEVSPVPAQRWHLARRNLILMPTPSPLDPSNNRPAWANDPMPGDPIDPVKLTDDALLEGKFDVVANYYFDKQVFDINANGPLGGFPLCLPRFLDGSGLNLQRPYVRSRLDLSPIAKAAARLSHYMLPNCASFKVEWSLDPDSEFVGGRLDGEAEAFWFDPGAEPDPTKSGAPARSLASLEDAAARAAQVADSSTNPRDIQRAIYLNDLLTAPLGRAAPAYRYSLQQRFGSDPVWQSVGHENGNRRNFHVFTANRLDEPNGQVIPEDIFPAALRITVDVYDAARRLERPIRHVIVVPVGE